MKPRDRKAIEILLRIGSVLGVSPMNSLSQIENQPKGSLNLFLLLVSLTMCVFSIYFNVRDNYVNMKQMDVFVDLLSMVVNGILGAVIIIGPLFNSAIWKKLLLELQCNKKLMQCDGNKEKETHHQVYTEIIVCHIVFMARFSWDAYVWICCHGIDIYKNYLYRFFNEYCAMIAILIMVHLNLVVKNYFYLLNNALWAIVQNSNHCVVEKPTHLALLSAANSYNKVNNIRRVQTAYRKLSKMIDHFNAIFGYQILLLMGYTVAVTLGSLHSALKYNNFNEKMDAMVLSWSVISSTIIVVSFFNLTDRIGFMLFIYFFRLKQLQLLFRATLQHAKPERL